MRCALVSMTSWQVSNRERDASTHVVCRAISGWVRSQRSVSDATNNPVDDDYICPPRLLHLLFGIALYRWPPGSQRATKAQTGANGGSIA